MVLHSVRNVIDQVTAWEVERRNGVDVDGSVFSTFHRIHYNEGGNVTRKREFPLLPSVCNRSGV